MPTTPSARPPFDLKSTAWILTALRLHTAEVPALAAALQERFGDSAGLFDDDPLVLDLSPLRSSEALPDFSALLQALQAHGMQVVAAQGGNAAQMEAARAAGLPPATDPEHRPERAPAAAPEPGPAHEPVPGTEAAADDSAPAAAAGAATSAAEPPPAPPLPVQAQRRPTLVVDKPLRSGQRVYARGGDLVVLAPVSFGAEVIADGNIHVYGPLRGRAMAGARGDESARIFCTALEPQLMSIAGIYRTAETPLPPAVAGKPAQVRLQGDSLIIEPLA